MLGDPGWPPPVVGSIGLVAAQLPKTTVYSPPDPVIADTATLCPVAGLNQNSRPGVVRCRFVPLMLNETADSVEHASCTNSGT